MKTLNCTYCNNDFHAIAGRGRPMSYCSNACKYKALKDPLRYCRGCRNQFTPVKGEPGAPFFCSEACHMSNRLAYNDARPDRFARAAALATQAATATAAHAYVRPTHHSYVAFKADHAYRKTQLRIPQAMANGNPYMGIPPELTNSFQPNPYWQHAIDMQSYILNNEPVPYKADLPLEAWMVYQLFLRPVSGNWPNMQMPRSHRIWPWIYNNLSSEVLQGFDQQKFERIIRNLHSQINVWRKVHVTMPRSKQIALIQRSVAVHKAWRKGDLDGLMVHATGSEAFRRKHLVANPAFYDASRPESYRISLVQVLTKPAYEHWWPTSTNPQHVSEILLPCLEVTEAELQAIVKHSQRLSDWVRQTILDGMTPTTMGTAYPAIQASDPYSVMLTVLDLLVEDPDIITAGRLHYNTDPAVPWTVPVPWTNHTLDQIMLDINEYRTTDQDSWLDHFIEVARLGGLNCNNDDVGVLL